MANPRSPESGDVPEYVPAGKDAAWYREKLNAALHRNGEYARRENAERARAQHLQFELDDRDAEVSRLTAELSTARERAERAEQLANAAIAYMHDGRILDAENALLAEAVWEYQKLFAPTPNPDHA